MRILLTGASGFLGQHIYKVVRELGEIITISRKDANINIDLAKTIFNLPEVDWVIHCAGKAHSLPKTALETEMFFNVNLNGTFNLIKGLELVENLPKSFVFISTVAVYGCEFGQMIMEESPLNAKDPYGLSKIKAEQLVQDWCSKNGVVCSILRLPLLVGENPPGNLGAMIKGIKKGYYFDIAGGKAKKSMVLAKDVAELIPIVAKIGGIYNLTDNYHPSFAELSAVIAKQLQKPKPLNLPLWLAKIVSSVGDIFGDMSPITTKKLSKITSDLTFDDSKAKKELNWKPNPILEGFEEILK